MSTFKRLFVWLLMTGFMIGIGYGQQQPQKPDTRVWSISYWQKMAKLGLVEFNKEVKVPPAIYTGSEITLPGGQTITSIDIPIINSTTVTQSENSVFVNPQDPNKVLNSNNSTDWPVTQIYGTSAFMTTDGGNSWSGQFQGTGGSNGGDPAAVIDMLNRYYVGYIAFNNGQGVAYSTDEGATWTHVQIANTSFGGLLDKNHLWADNMWSSPYLYNLYSAWSNLDGGTNYGEIEISRSTTNGTSWSTPVAISTAIAAGSHNQGVNLKTGPNGEVYAVWAVYDSWPADETALGFAKSTDGGVTWQPATRIISNIRGIRITGTSKNMRVNSFPAMAVDISGGPYNGSIYVVWANYGTPGINTGPDIDVYMIRSTDGGTTWSSPIRVNQDTPGLGKEHYFPWITCDPVTGNLSVIFYDDRNVSSTQCEVFVATSSDGGTTWSDFKVSDVAFTPTPIPGLATGYFGDYLGISAYNDQVYPVWTDNRTGNALAYTSPFTFGVITGPDITVSPSSFSFVLPTGGTASQTLTIGNVGTANLNWNITEQQLPLVMNDGTIIPAKIKPAARSSYKTTSGIHYVEGNAGQIRQESQTNSSIYTGKHTPARKISKRYANSPALVALFKDQNPWGTTTNEDILNANGISYDVYTSSDMGTVNLTPYDKVIIASEQTDAFYTALSTNSAWFESYVNAGGYLEMHLAALFTSSLPGMLLPGGYVVAPWETNGIENVSIVDPTHPIFNTPNTVTDANLDNWSYSSHGTFSAAPAGAVTLVENVDFIPGTPCVMENVFGAGAIFVTLQPVEWSGAYLPYLENIILYDGLATPDCPWLSENPVSGTVPPGGNQNVTITADATGLTPGSYDCNLVIHSNDPDENPVTVPVHLLVTPPGGFDALVWDAFGTPLTPQEIVEKVKHEKGETISLKEAERLSRLTPTQSATEIVNALTNLGLTSNLVFDISTEDFNNYNYVFVVLGQFPNNHTILAGSAEATKIENYIAGGGHVYMEGGDVWYYDPLFGSGHDFGPTFGINPIADGAFGGELSNIVGHSFAAGLDYAYNVGTDNYPDHIDPTGTGFLLHENTSPVFNCGIGNEPSGRTIGTSFEFGQLIDGAVTKTDLMAAYINFFDNGLPAPDITVTPTSFTFTVPPGGTDTQVMTIGNVGNADLNWNITEQQLPLVMNDGRILSAKIRPSRETVKTFQPAPKGDINGTASRKDVKIRQSEFTPSNRLASTVVIETGLSITNSILQALNELGVAYDFIATSDFTTIDFTPYNTIILGMDGGLVSDLSVQTVANEAASGKKLIIFGGSNYGPFYDGVMLYLLQHNNVQGWTISATPHLTVTDPTHPLAAGLPPTYNYVNSSAAYYCLRITDPAAVEAAQNGDGFPALINKPIGSGMLIYSISSPYDGYYGDPGDYGILKTILTNALNFTTDCPWLSESPVSGTIPAGGSQNVDVMVDATGLTPGTYNCNMLINSNDPDENPVTVPVTLNVTAPCDFAANLLVQDACVDNQNLVFGTCAGATDGYDPGLDQLAPPPPPTGAFDARLRSSVDDFLIDYRTTNVDSTIIWDVIYQAATGCDPVTLTWNPAELPADASIFTLVDFVTGGSLVNVDMRTNTSYTDVLGLGHLQIVYSFAVTFNKDVMSGWNMIGLPLIVADPYYLSVFPNAVPGTLFGFNGSYTPEDTIHTCTGYWLRFPSAQTQAITGTPLNNCSIDLMSGWNMIAGPYCDVALTDVGDPGGIIIPGTLFGFNGSYFPADTIKKGEGYWIKASAAGTITVNCGGTPLAKGSSQPAVVLPDESQFSQITISDAAGKAQTLFFNAELEDQALLASYSMPPLPPPGAFDARFVGDYRLTTGDEAVIEVQASAFPLTVTFHNLQQSNGSPLEPGFGYVLKEVVNGRVVAEHNITEGATITITNSRVNNLLLSKVGTVPTVFAVGQNYPNPFNPTTTIKYAIPSPEKVTITIYNALGQKVKTLVNKQQDAGYYTVVWDATNDGGMTVGSGIYFYVVKAGKHRKIMKMVLLK